MNTRLDRLITLLETSSSEEGRLLAADQLRDFAKARIRRRQLVPVRHILGRMSLLLCHPSEGVRVGASKAYEKICACLPTYVPPPVVVGAQSSLSVPTQDPSRLYLRFENFDLEDVLRRPRLVKSGEDDVQRRPGQRPLKRKREFGSARAAPTPSSSKRRKVVGEAAPPAAAASADAGVENSSSRHQEGTPPEHLQDEIPPDRWFLEDQLWGFLGGLTHTQWIIRHGSALGLRALLASPPCALSIGRRTSLGTSSDPDHHRCVVHCTLVVLTVLLLDRFGEYTGDAVRAPVREPCGDLVRILVGRMLPPDEVSKAIRVLVQMLGHVGQRGVPVKTPSGSSWEIRQSGLIGISALLSRGTGSQLCISELVPWVVRALSDPSEDVRALAAEALRPDPVTTALLANVGLLDGVLGVLWRSLHETDDLAMHFGAFLGLLASLYSPAPTAQNNGSLFNDRTLSHLPLLWKFLRHNMLEVRRSAIEMVVVLLGHSSRSRMTSPDVVSDALHFLFQNVVVGSDVVVLRRTGEAWRSLCSLLVGSACRVMPRDFGRWATIVSLRLSGDGRGREVPVELLRSPAEEFATTASRVEFESDEDVLVMRKRACGLLAFVPRSFQADGSLEACPFVRKLCEKLLSSSWSAHREVAALLLLNLPQPPYLATLLSVLTQRWPVYSDLNDQHGAFIRAANALMQFLAQRRVDMQPYLDAHAGVDLGNFKELTEKFAPLASCTSDGDLARLEQLKGRVEDAAERYRLPFDVLHSRVSSLLSGAFLHSATLSGVSLSQPPAATAVAACIGHLLWAVRHGSEALQEGSARALRILTLGLPATCPKIVHILCGLICVNRPPLETIGDLVGSERAAGREKSKKRKKKVSGDLSLLAQAARDGRVVQDPRATCYRGARLALLEIVRGCAGRIFELAPNFQAFSFSAIQSREEPKVRDGLALIRTVAGTLDPSLRSRLLADVLKRCCGFVAFEGVQVDAAHTIGCLADLDFMTLVAMKQAYASLVPILRTSRNDVAVRGAAFAIYQIVQRLQLRILPYVVLFVVPILQRMSDHDFISRSVAAASFGYILKILPLEKATPSPPEFQALASEERGFVEQLLDLKKIPPYQLPPGLIVGVTLRPYQQEGVSWLGFLDRFHLHGILCDDMGLGKTLQTICIVASSRYHRRRRVAGDAGSRLLPCLVVCPGTLVDHWKAEFARFAPSVSVLKFCGPPAVRGRLFASVANFDVIVMSYSSCRSDIPILSSRFYDYVILDEGHVIKNPSSKLTQAVKRLKATHRLILSGTPVQNTVLDLWSLFDFLMPGFLGNAQRTFNRKYSKPIQSSRTAKADSAVKRQGILALQALHRQVLPFILRRLKEDVLEDLPPKIIQDYYCEMSPLQRDILKHFEATISGNQGSSFERLSFLRKLCNHPSFVLKDLLGHPLHAQVSRLGVPHFSHSPKLLSLQQLLSDLGFGSEGSDHRALIFCQTQETVNLVITALLEPAFPECQYLRLDGTVEEGLRHGVATRFNADPTYELMILTKKVGGLGLNLPGADVVIFVEVDWNPAIDLQAMDRAHRIGQKKVVNVFRLITKNTIEEKILGLQKFKLSVSKSIVNEDNRGVGTMASAGQVADRFVEEEQAEEEGEDGLFFVE